MKSEHPDINDTLRNEGEEAVRARHDSAPKYQSKKPNGKTGDDESLPYIDIAREPLPERKWFVRDKFPATNVCLFSGEGGKGKSRLLYQLSGATALARDWIGTLPDPGPVIYLSCEEDSDELCRGLEAVAKSYGASRKELAEHLHFLSYAGMDATLGAVDRKNNKVQPTDLFNRLHRNALRIKPKLIVLDTAADVFDGDEINRTQTRRFINMLRKPAIETDATVILVSHPSLTGIASGSGLSGSTAWHNTVRARAYLKSLIEDDGDKGSGLRVVDFKKNNYGPISDSIILRWREGVYVPEPGRGSIEQAADQQKVDDLFITLLKRRIGQNRNVSDHPSSTYAPAVFAEEKEAKENKISKKAFTESMTRLFNANRIRVVSEGPASRRRSKIVEVEQ